MVYEFAKFFFFHVVLIVEAVERLKVVGVEGFLHSFLLHHLLDFLVASFRMLRHDDD